MKNLDELKKLRDELNRQILDVEKQNKLDRTKYLNDTYIGKVFKKIGAYDEYCIVKGCNISESSKEYFYIISFEYTSSDDIYIDMHDEISSSLLASSYEPVVENYKFNKYLDSMIDQISSYKLK